MIQKEIKRQVNWSSFYKKQELSSVKKKCRMLSPFVLFLFCNIKLIHQIIKCKVCILDLCLNVIQDKQT